MTRQEKLHQRRKREEVVRRFLQEELARHFHVSHILTNCMYCLQIAHRRIYGESTNDPLSDEELQELFDGCSK
jgi:hypothetical protein